MIEWKAGQIIERQRKRGRQKREKREGYTHRKKEKKLLQNIYFTILMAKHEFLHGHKSVIHNGPLYTTEK